MDILLPQGVIELQCRRLVHQRKVVRSRANFYTRCNKCFRSIMKHFSLLQESKKTITEEISNRKYNVPNGS